jgi:hypothetical protein
MLTDHIPEIFERLLTWLYACLYWPSGVKSMSFKFFRWSLSTYILWLRVIGNLPCGLQNYYTIFMYFNKQCSTVNTLQIWIKMWHKQNKKIFSVCAEIWTQIFRMSNRKISQLCHSALNNGCWISNQIQIKNTF